MLCKGYQVKKMSLIGWTKHTLHEGGGEKYADSKRESGEASGSLCLVGEGMKGDDEDSDVEEERRPDKAA